MSLSRRTEDLCDDPLDRPKGALWQPDDGLDGRAGTDHEATERPRLGRCIDLGDDGVPRNRRGFIDMHQHPGRPDGAAVDADGGYWICANDAGLVLRFTPDGRLDRQLAVPAAKVAMCAFFGPRLDRMVVTTIRPAAPLAGWDHALAGAVFVLDPGCQGLGEMPFSDQP